MWNLITLNVGAENVSPDRSFFKNCILLPLVFEIELFNLMLAFQFLARKPVSGDRFSSKLAQRLFHMFST